MKHALLFTTLLSLSLWGGLPSYLNAQSVTSPVYLDASRPMEERVEDALSRMTIIVEADEVGFEQITKQLHKLVSVYKISDLTYEEAVERELVLFKVQSSPERRHEVIEIANVFRAKVVDVGKNTLTIEATGTASKLDAMEDLFRSYGIKQLTRTGKIAMSRGAQ